MLGLDVVISDDGMVWVKATLLCAIPDAVHGGAFQPKLFRDYVVLDAKGFQRDNLRSCCHVQFSVLYAGFVVVSACLWC